jgi:hypothetical protein
MPEFIGYEEAWKQGLKYYFDGRPCKYGHIAEKHVANQNCTECICIKYHAASAMPLRLSLDHWKSAE